jgi:hypothetical protein
VNYAVRSLRARLVSRSTSFLVRRHRHRRDDATFTLADHVLIRCALPFPESGFALLKIWEESNRPRLSAAQHVAGPNFPRLAAPDKRHFEKLDAFVNNGGANVRSRLKRDGH